MDKIKLLYFIILYCIAEASVSASSTRRLIKLDKTYANCKNINLREVTLTQLQTALESRQLTSLDLVRCYTKRIQKMDPFLNSVAEINPEAERIAIWLDLERFVNKKARGSLYGIPVLVKDNIGTGDLMETTAGSAALLGIKALKDAQVIKKLKQAGAIIFGKAQMSEFASFRGTNVPEGWSSRHGQTHNAYVLSEYPEGSSSGSAVAVASNLIPVAIGSDTVGSITLPCDLASCVALRSNRISTEGVIPLAATQDTVGPMTRTVTDAALVFDAISENGLRSQCFSAKTGFSKCSIQGNRLGVLRNPNWSRETMVEQLPTLERILVTLKNLGVDLIDPVEGPNDILKRISMANKLIIYTHEWKVGINSYLKDGVRTNTNKAGHVIRDVNDIVAFNTKFPSADGYNHEKTIAASRINGLDEVAYKRARKNNQEGATHYVTTLFETYELDAVIIPTNGGQLVPASAGLPQITIPAGLRSDQIPYGVSLYGPKNSEETLFALAYWIEKKHPARSTPKFLP